MLRDEEEIFAALNRRLEQDGIELTVICVGGFVLSHHGLRATVDVGGFYKSSEKLDKAIKEVGDELGLNLEDELWLNNSVQDLNPPPPEDICEPLYEFPNLRVLIPPLEYVAGMKLMSGRGQDVDDAAAIIRLENISSPEDFLRKMGEYRLAPIDESMLLEAFGIAYGMDWLEAYYVEHEVEIQERIRRS